MSDGSDQMTVRLPLDRLMRLPGAFRPQVATKGHKAAALATAAPSPPTGQEYRRGHDDGHAVGLATAAAEKQQLLGLIASAEAIRNEPSEELAQLIAETVDGLVRRILGEVALDRDMLRRRAAACAALIVEADGARTMWLHPDDKMLLGEAPLGLALRDDPAAERGSIRIDCSAGWIEHGTALHLDALRAELGLEGRDA